MQEYVKITLLKRTPTEVRDEYGDFVIIDEPRDVWAQCKSISQNEFYQAQTAGMKPALKFILKTSRDYCEEKELIYDGRKYEIQRTYITPADEIELTVYGGVRK